MAGARKTITHSIKKVIDPCGAILYLDLLWFDENKLKHMMMICLSDKQSQKEMKG